MLTFLIDLLDRFSVNRKNPLTKAIAVVLFVCAFIVGYRALWPDISEAGLMFSLALLGLSLVGLGKLTPRRNRPISRPSEYPEL